MDSWKASFASELGHRLSQPLPGWRAQRTFAPELSYGRHAGPPPARHRSASVLALCYPQHEQWHVVLTLRPASLPIHAGQVCFPGGEIEHPETPEHCALRELNEELGVATSDVQILGELSPIYIYASHFLVTPVVGFTPHTPQFRADPREVAEVIPLPLALLARGAHHGEHWIDRRGLRFRAPHIEYAGRRIWGATSMILAEFAEVLRELRFPFGAILT